MHIIKILGTGCKKCSMQAQEAEKAASQYSEELSIKKVTDLSEIVKFNVMSTPAVVIDNIVVSSGRVIKANEILKKLVDKDS